MSAVMWFDASDALLQMGESNAPNPRIRLVAVLVITLLLNIRHQVIVMCFGCMCVCYAPNI